MRADYIQHMGSDFQECRGCSEDLPVDRFPVRNDRSGRLRPYCKECSNNIERKRYEYHRESQPFKHKCTRAKSRASYLKVPFDLTPEYLENLWTGTCAALGVEISLTGSRVDEYVAELDRFIPEKGYIQGNVHFLSRKANRLKNNATVEQLRSICEWMESCE